MFPALRFSFTIHCMHSFWFMCYMHRGGILVLIELPLLFLIATAIADTFRAAEESYRTN